jgi:transcription initiation factor IIE alpha subunit
LAIQSPQKSRILNSEFRIAEEHDPFQFVLDFVRENPGLTQDQIREKTGIKHNSVRGTLWQLSTEKLIERRAGKWFPRSEENEALASETGEGGATNAAPA